MKSGKFLTVRYSALTLGLLGLSTVIGGLFSSFELHETNIVVVYIFSVLLISRFTKGYLYGIAASVVSLLFKNAGKVLTTRHILREIYGIGYGTDTQALRALMAGLRRKIEPIPAKPRYILTEIGVGYRLADE